MLGCLSIAEETLQWYLRMPENFVRFSSLEVLCQIHDDVLDELDLVYKD